MNKKIERKKSKRKIKVKENNTNVHKLFVFTSLNSINLF